MRFEVTETDYNLLCSVLNILREKGGRNPSITRMEIVRETGLSNQLIGSKIKNSYLKQKQLKENIP
ncbi:MarR family transcriptional regulator [Sulfurospirillum sp. 'SP']|nr:hypothetical protein [Sulfurospirillum sp. 'SP']WNY98749.1 MarR family transcriptional regulator [Sulfurospirillum sp. 'SP']